MAVAQHLPDQDADAEVLRQSVTWDKSDSPDHRREEVDERDQDQRCGGRNASTEAGGLFF